MEEQSDFKQLQRADSDFELKKKKWEKWLK